MQKNKNIILLMSGVHLEITNLEEKQDYIKYNLEKI